MCSVILFTLNWSWDAIYYTVAHPFISHFISSSVEQNHLWHFHGNWGWDQVTGSCPRQCRRCHGAWLPLGASRETDRGRERNCYNVTGGPNRPGVTPKSISTYLDFSTQLMTKGSCRKTATSSGSDGCSQYILFVIEQEHWFDESTVIMGVVII